MAVDLLNLSGEALKIELHRRSLDLLVVHNPLKDPYTLIWNTVERHIIPGSDTDIGYGKGNASLMRFLAEKYMTEMTTFILTKESEEKVKAENRKRESEGKQPMSKHTEGEQVQMEPRTDNPEARERTMKKLFVRLDREYAGGVEELVLPDKKPTMNRQFDGDLFDKIMGTTAEPASVEEVE